MKSSYTSQKKTRILHDSGGSAEKYSETVKVSRLQRLSLEKG